MKQYTKDLVTLLGFFPFHLFYVTVMSCYVDIFVFELSVPFLLWLTNDESGVILTLNIIQLACITRIKPRCTCLVR